MITLLHASLVVATLAQAPQGSPQDAPAEVPWPARLGLRAWTCEMSRPVAEQVTLVPDAATFLDEVSRWTPEARWPVLIDEPRLAPTFIRAFKPQRVVRRTSVGPAPDPERVREALLAASKKACPECPTAPCAVVTSPTDRAWVAALALSAGRGAPVAILDGEFGAPNDVLGATDFARLEAGLAKALDGLGLPWRELGDEIDAIAICRSLAAKATPDIPPEWRPPLPPNEARPTDPGATVDALARRPTGERSAVVGWIFGTEAQSAYMAMCSLFLPRKEVQFISGYGQGEPWSFYDPTKASSQMSEQGFKTSLHVGDQATLSAWEKLLLGGFSCDVLVVNSSGDPDFFNLANTERASVGDVPLLDKPVALHLIHSWSLTRPTDIATVGGKFLDRGVYAYVGSVQEPFLGAFVPPNALASRWLGLGPFLVSGRMLEGPFDRVWRLTLIGDPLCTLAPPKQPAPPKAPLPPLNGMDVLEEAKALMREFARSGDESKAHEAMKRLVLCGADEVAVGFYAAARSRGMAAAVADDALGPLFRARAFADFVEAFSLCREPSPDALDMLWHLATPRVQALKDDQVDLLVRNLRGPDVSSDLRRVLPAVDRVMGRRASDRLVQEAMARTKDPGVTSRLSTLLRR